MSIDVEYAIKKDIRNNPVVREVDVQQKREFRRTLWLAGVIVGDAAVLRRGSTTRSCSSGYEIEKLRRQRASRRRRSTASCGSSSRRCARRRTSRSARVSELHMVGARRRRTRSCIERVPAATPGKAIVADAREVRR